MLIFDRRLANQSDSSPVRSSHRRTTKLNREKDAEQTVDYDSKRTTTTTTISNSSTKRKTQSNSNNNNNNKKQKKINSIYDKQRMHFKSSYELLFTEKEKNNLNNECLDKQTLAECIYISCFHDTDERISRFLAYGLNRAQPVDFLDPDAGKAYLLKLFDDDKLHHAHNDSLLLDEFDRAGMRGPVSADFKKKIPNIDNVHDEFVDILDSSLTTLAVQIETMRKTMSKQYDFNTTKKSNDDTNTATTSKFENIINNWNSIMKKTSGVPRNLTKIAFDCVGVAERGVDANWKKKLVVQDLTPTVDESLNGSALVDTDINQEERETFYYCQTSDAKTNLKTTLKDMVLNRVEMIGADVKALFRAIAVARLAVYQSDADLFSELLTNMCFGCGMYDVDELLKNRYEDPKMDVLKLIEELIDVFQHVHWLRLDYQRTQTRVPNQKKLLKKVYKILKINLVDPQIKKNNKKNSTKKKKSNSKARKFPVIKRNDEVLATAQTLFVRVFSLLREQMNGLNTNCLRKFTKDVEEIEPDPESSRTNDLEQFDNLFKLCYCLWNTLIEETWFSIDNENIDGNILQSVGYRAKTQRNFIPEIDRQAAVRVNGGVLFPSSLNSRARASLLFGRTGYSLQPHYEYGTDRFTHNVIQKNNPNNLTFNKCFFVATRRSLRQGCDLAGNLIDMSLLGGHGRQKQSDFAKKARAELVAARPSSTVVHDEHNVVDELKAAKEKAGVIKNAFASHAVYAADAGGDCALTAVRVTRDGVIDSHAAHTGSGEGAAFNHGVAIRVGTAGQVDQFRRHELLVPRDALFGSLVLNNDLNGTGNANDSDDCDEDDSGDSDDSGGDDDSAGVGASHGASARSHTVKVIGHTRSTVSSTSTTTTSTRSTVDSKNIGNNDKEMEEDKEEIIFHDEQLTHNDLDGNSVKKVKDYRNKVNTCAKTKKTLEKPSYYQQKHPKTLEPVNAPCLFQNSKIESKQKTIKLLVVLECPPLDEKTQHGLTISSLTHLRHLLNNNNVIQNTTVVVDFVDCRTQHIAGSTCLPPVSPEECRVLRRPFCIKNSNGKYLRGNFKVYDCIVVLGNFAQQVVFGEEPRSAYGIKKNVNVFDQGFSRDVVYAPHPGSKKYIGYSDQEHKIYVSKIASLTLASLKKDFDVVQHYNKILKLDIWSDMIADWRTDRFCQFDFGRRIDGATLERALTLLPSRRLPLDRFKARRLLEPYVRLIEKQNDLNAFQIEVKNGAHQLFAWRRGRVVPALYAADAHAVNAGNERCASFFPTIKTIYGIDYARREAKWNRGIERKMLNILVQTRAVQHPHLSAAQLAQLETESWHENPTKDQRRQRHYQKIKSFRTGVQNLVLVVGADFVSRSGKRGIRGSKVPTKRFLRYCRRMLGSRFIRITEQYTSKSNPFTHQHDHFIGFGTNPYRNKIFPLEKSRNISMSYGSFKDCRILNRDIAAALNIAFIAQNLANGKKRLECFLFDNQVELREAWEVAYEECHSLTLSQFVADLDSKLARMSPFRMAQALYGVTGVQS